LPIDERRNIDAGQVIFVNQLLRSSNQGIALASAPVDCLLSVSMEFPLGFDDCGEALCNGSGEIRRD